MSRKDLPSPNAANFLPRVREEIHALLGKLGSSRDRALTLQDAIDSGVIVPGPGGGLIPGPGAGAEPYVQDLTPPPQPGNLTAAAMISHILLEVPAATYTQGHGHLRTRVYGAIRVGAAPAPVFANAVEVGQFDGTVWAMPSNPATTWHLWAKWESKDGVLSATPAGGTNGVVATTAQDVGLLLDALAGQITGTQLHSDLSTPIGLITAPDTVTGSVNQRVAAAQTAAATALAAAQLSIDGQISSLQSTVSDLSGTPDYDNAEAYAADKIVKYNGALYRALQATVGNLPTNAAYWEKIGDYGSLGDAVAAHSVQLANHETRVSATEATASTHTTQIAGLTTDLGGKASSASVAALSNTVGIQGGTLTAQGNSINSLQTTIQDPTAGLAATRANVTTLQNTQSTQAGSIATLTNNVAAAFTAAQNAQNTADSKASSTRVDQVEANAASALATAATSLQSTMQGIGGENLYLGQDPLVAGPGVYGIVGEVLKDGDTNPNKLVPGEKLTISAELLRDAAAAADGAASVIYLVSTKSDGTWTLAVSLVSSSMTPEKQVATLQLPASVDDMAVVKAVLYHQSGTTNVTGTVSALRIQIERGSVDTAYKIGLRNASAAITTLQQTQATQGGAISTLSTSVDAAAVAAANAQTTANSRATVAQVDQAKADAISASATSVQNLQSKMDARTISIPLEQWALNGHQIVALTDGKVGNKALRLTGLSGQYPNQGVYIAIDRTKTYRVSFLARPSADNATGLLYFSLYQFTDSGVGPVNGGRSPYKPSGQNPAAHNNEFGPQQWGLYSFTWGPADWQAGVTRVLPEFLDNYPAAAGNWEVQDFHIVDATAVESINAQITTIQDTLTTSNGAIATLGTNVTAAMTAAQNAQTTANSRATVAQVDQAKTDAISAAATNTQFVQAQLEGQIAAKADASALTTTNTNVSNLGGTVAAQANQITTLQSRSGNGGNLIDNSEFARDLSGWACDATLTLGRNYSEYWTVFPGTAFMQEGVPNANPAFYHQASPGTYAVIPGKRYQWSIYTGAHRCLVQAFIYWKDAGGNIIGNTTLDANDEEATGGPSLDGYKRLKSFGVAPVGASVAYPILRKTTTKAGNTSSYAFFTRALFCEASATQTEPDAYSPGQMVASLQVEATTRATQTGLLLAQYVVKLDVNGHYAGYGLASDQNGNSEFIASVNRFAVTSPETSIPVWAASTNYALNAIRRIAGTSSKSLVCKQAGISGTVAPTISGAIGTIVTDGTVKWQIASRVPFSVLTVPTTINGVSLPAGAYFDAAYILNATVKGAQIGDSVIDNSHIASVSAEKITAGSIAVGQYIQSFDYTAGSLGWRIWHNGAEFNQVVVRGTIFASQGAIGGWTIGSNYLQSNTYALGSTGTRLNSDGTGQIGGITIYPEGLGAGSSAYNTGAGSWIGRDGRVSLRNASGSNYLRWDGSSLQIAGELQGATGYFSGDVSANSLSTNSGRFTVSQSGAVVADMVDIRRRLVLETGLHDTITQIIGGYSTPVDPETGIGGYTNYPPGSVFSGECWQPVLSNVYDYSSTDTFANQPYFASAIFSSQSLPGWSGSNGSTFQFMVFGRCHAVRTYSNAGNFPDDYRLAISFFYKIKLLSGSFNSFWLPPVRWMIYKA